MFGICIYTLVLNFDVYKNIDWSYVIRAMAHNGRQTQVGGINQVEPFFQAAPIQRPVWVSSSVTVLYPKL